MVAAQPGNKAFWELYLDYVYKYGDLVEIQRLEKRYGELFPESLKKNVARFSCRYSFLGLNLELETTIDAEKQSQHLQSSAEEREKASKKKKGSREETTAQHQASQEVEAVKENEPDVLTKFLRILPPATSYNGPRMATEEIVSLIMRTNLPENRPRAATAGDESDDDATHRSKRNSRSRQHLQKRQRNE